MRRIAFCVFCVFCGLKTAATVDILSIQNLKVWFPIRKGILNRVVGYVRAVDGVSLQVAPGETLALVGESGCGKTTLGRAILGLVPVTSGEIAFEGRSLEGLSSRELRKLRRHCQMVFQDPFSSLNPRMTILDILTEAMVYHGLVPAAKREEAAISLLAEVGLGPDVLHRYPHEFSGGQRQRISIARALSLQPSFLICDEPVSALDVSVQAQVINLLMDLREKRHLAYLFISHDLSVVRLIAQRIAVMYLGRIVETGPAKEVMESPLHPYTQALLAAVPKPGRPRGEMRPLEGEQPSPANPPAGCPFHPRCPHATPECARECPSLQGFSHQVACLHIQTPTQRTNP
ncbi:MAG: ABC transporter ATP-binding protein [Victivallales bacterium]|nr:ABC transporter ATP-binding protein [Victivallales bacterium]